MTGQRTFKFKLTAWVVLAAFAGSVFLPLAGQAWAGEITLPAPTQAVHISGVYDFPVLKGLRLDPRNPLRLEFIIDSGNQEKVDKQEAARLVRYFLAALTIPQEDFWVNLSPHEKDRIAPENLSLTDLGKDLLAQDYLLKQFSSSLSDPRGDTGKSFWQNLYQELFKLKGTTDLPINTLNKIWIVPDAAEVNEDNGLALVTRASLKVMMEDDYGAIKNRKLKIKNSQTQEITAQMMRKVILPVIAKEVNSGKNFAQLRQIYHSLILAIWFKQKFQQSLYAAYIDKGKISGIDLKDKGAREKIFKLYVEAFGKGVYNYLKKEVDPGNNKIIKRQYYCGGADFTQRNFARFTAGPSAQVLGAGPLRNPVKLVVDVAGQGASAMLNQMSAALDLFKRHVLEKLAVGQEPDSRFLAEQFGRNDFLEQLWVKFKQARQTQQLKGLEAAQEVFDQAVAVENALVIAEAFAGETAPTGGIRQVLVDRISSRVQSVGFNDGKERLVSPGQMSLLVSRDQSGAYTFLEKDRHARSEPRLVNILGWTETNLLLGEAGILEVPPDKADSKVMPERVRLAIRDIQTGIPDSGIRQEGFGLARSPEDIAETVCETLAGKNGPLSYFGKKGVVQFLLDQVDSETAIGYLFKRDVDSREAAESILQQAQTRFDAASSRMGQDQSERPDPEEIFRRRIAGKAPWPVEGKFQPQEKSPEEIQAERRAIELKLQQIVDRARILPGSDVQQLKSELARLFSEYQVDPWQQGRDANWVAQELSLSTADVRELSGTFSPLRLRELREFIAKNFVDDYGLIESSWIEFAEFLKDLNQGVRIKKHLITLEGKTPREAEKIISDLKQRWGNVVSSAMTAHLVSRSLEMFEKSVLGPLEKGVLPDKAVAAANDDSVFASVYGDYLEELNQQPDKPLECARLAFDKGVAWENSLRLVEQMPKSGLSAGQFLYGVMNVSGRIVEINPSIRLLSEGENFFWLDAVGVFGAAPEEYRFRATQKYSGRAKFVLEWTEKYLLNPPHEPSRAHVNPRPAVLRKGTEVFNEPGPKEWQDSDSLVWENQAPEEKPDTIFS